ncbi:MAG: DNA repair protein RecO [Thermoguttaceae bacterium]|nr:DNA repair protein RecO [Thermoguttaceae bacterium]
MAYESATAIIIRLVEWSESSLVLTFFTRESGKLHMLAKGARRPKAPFDSALDLLSSSRISFLRKSSDALHLVTEAKLLRWFRLPPDLPRWYAGFYIAELLDTLTETEQPIPELFDLTESIVQELSGEPSDGIHTPRYVNVATAITRWEMATLTLLGLFPDLSGCSGCGDRVVYRGRAAFHSSDGLLCPACRGARRFPVESNELDRNYSDTHGIIPAVPNTRNAYPSSRFERGGLTVSIAESTLELMRQLVDLRVPLVSLYSTPMPAELRRIMNQWIADQLGRIPRTAAPLAQTLGPFRLRRYVNPL